MSKAPKFQKRLCSNTGMAEKKIKGELSARNGANNRKEAMSTETKNCKKANNVAKKEEILMCLMNVCERNSKWYHELLEVWRDWKKYDCEENFPRLQGNIIVN